MADIPTEIFYHHIFLKLPVQSLLRFRCVCKTWYRLLRDEDFLIRHFNQSTQQKSHKLILKSHNQFYSVHFDASNNTNGHVDELKLPYGLRGLLCTLGIIDSCNGLLCIGVKQGPSYKDTNILVWNPSTGDSRLLPNPNPSVQFDKHPLGFAYDSSVDDYKILRLADPNFQVYMYTLRTNSWRSIGNAPSFAVGMSRTGRFMDGCIFWLHHSRSRVGQVYMIVYFDLKDESFKVLPLPRELQQGEVTDLRVLGEYLGMIHLSPTKYQLWIMNNNNKEEWIKIISMHFDRVEFWVYWTRPVWINKNGEVVILARFNGSDQLRFMIYDPKRGSLEEYPIRGFAGIYSYDESTYIESFVSPNFEQKG